MPDQPGSLRKRGSWGHKLRKGAEYINGKEWNGAGVCSVGPCQCAATHIAEYRYRNAQGFVSDVGRCYCGHHAANFARKHGLRFEPARRVIVEVEGHPVASEPRRLTG